MANANIGQLDSGLCEPDAVRDHNRHPVPTFVAGQRSFGRDPRFVPGRPASLPNNRIFPRDNNALQLTVPLTLLVGDSPGVT